MHTKVRHFDLSILTSWQYDNEFVDLIESTARREGVTTYRIGAYNLQETLYSVKNKKIKFSVLLDRASDEGETYLQFVKNLQKYSKFDDEKRLYIINPLEYAHLASDKASMHSKFVTHNIDVPFTIVIAPYARKKDVELSVTDLAKLGRSFIIKPANTTGGGMGVVIGAETLKEVLEARQHHRNDRYLLQETIKPIYFADNRAWFRVIYAFGEVIPCWWDDRTHSYSKLTNEEEKKFELKPLKTITERIAAISMLDFFSTEIACKGRNKFVVVDYVNEMCDMRQQSKHPDGVPDDIVKKIIHRMLEFVKFEKKKHRIHPFH